MSQKTEGLLNEEEVKSYLNETFNLKLTRDVLLNPKKDVVMDLYTKFLDYRNSKWRRLRSNPNATLLAAMVNRLRFMLKGYIPSHDKREFHLGDLVMPDRRRTNFFLNALIFTKVQVDDSYLEWQQWLAEWKQNEEVAIEIDRRLKEEKNELENLAIKKSQFASLDELREEIKKKKASVQDLESRYDETEREKNRIKDSIKARAEQCEEHETLNAKLREDVERKEQVLLLLNSGMNFKKEINELEQSLLEKTEKLKSVDKTNQDLQARIAGPVELLEDDEFLKFDAERTKKRLEYTIRLSQAEQRVKEVKFNREKESRQYSSEISRLNEDLENLDKLILKAGKDRAQAVEQVDEYDKKLKQRFNTAAQEYVKAKGSFQDAAINLEKMATTIKDLLGMPRDALPDQSNSVNRTYIKESAN